MTLAVLLSPHKPLLEPAGYRHAECSQACSQADRTEHSQLHVILRPSSDILLDIFTGPRQTLPGFHPMCPWHLLSTLEQRFVLLHHACARAQRQCTLYTFFGPIDAERRREGLLHELAHCRWDASLPEASTDDHMPAFHPTTFPPPQH